MSDESDLHDPAAASRHTPRSDSGSGESDSKDWTVSPALGAAVALVVAAFAAVGVSGDVLTRAVRNQPVGVAAMFVVALLAVGAVVIGSLFHNGRHRSRWHRSCSSSRRA